LRSGSNRRLAVQLTLPSVIQLHAPLIDLQLTVLFYQQLTMRCREPRDQSLENLLLLDGEHVVRLLDLAELASLHQSSDLGEGYPLLAVVEPAVVAASNAAETMTEASVLGFVALGSSHLALGLLASADPCKVEVRVAVAVQPPVPASVVQPPVTASAIQPSLPGALHL